MNVFYVFFPAMNNWRTWEGMDKETVEALASEFGEHEFRTKSEWDFIQMGQAAPQVEQKTE